MLAEIFTDHTSKGGKAIVYVRPLSSTSVRQSVRPFVSTLYSKLTDLELVRVSRS